ncbi:glycoside hydrolase family 51 protein [Hypoxylon sp. CI-4A]|nr:glycoside hydrolase family 51 protein [Hypoxylon sp. CI-4A]
MVADADLRVLVVWSGMNYADDILSPDDLEPYVQDALHQIEFLTGSSNTTFRAMRAAPGYPEPWPLKYVQVGNEDNLTGGLESYEEYWLQMFHDAIKARYPDQWGLTILSFNARRHFRQVTTYGASWPCMLRLRPYLQSPIAILTLYTTSLVVTRRTGPSFSRRPFTIARRIFQSPYHSKAAVRERQGA